MSIGRSGVDKDENGAKGGDYLPSSVGNFGGPSGSEQHDGKHQRFITKEQTLLPGFWRQLYATIAVCFGAFSAGNVLGWSGPMVLKLQSVETPVEDIESDSLNNLLTIMQLSSIFSMMACGLMMDTMGRRAGCWFLNLFAPAGWAFLAMAGTRYDLYVGGAMVGSTMAAGLVVGLVYISEVSNDKLRGPFLSLIVFFHSCGALFSHIIGEFVSYKSYNLICLFVSLLFPFVFHPLPESPLFLIIKSRMPEAKTSVEWYHGNDSEVVANEIRKLQNANIPRVACKTILSSRGYRFSLIIILFLSIFSELCGTTVIETYTGLIIHTVTELPDVARENTLILALLRFFAGLASVCMVEKTGRKLMLTYSLAVMSVSLIGLSVFLAVPPHERNSMSVWWVCSILSVYTLANQISLAVGEVICGEIASNDMRGMFMAIGGTVRILTLILCFQINTFFESFSYYGNSVFQAACCIVGTIVAMYIIPETRGKTLASIREEMEKEVFPERCEEFMRTRERYRLKKPPNL